MLFINRNLISLAALLIVALSGFAQEKNERYVDSNGEFSFDLPQGWRAYEMPNTKYKVAFGKRENGFSPNITVEDETFTRTLAEYATVAQQYAENNPGKLGVDSIKLLSKVEFMTASGQTGIKLTNKVTAKSGNVLLKQYLFEGKDKKKYVFTCGALVESAVSLESDYDKSMKSLIFAK